MDDERDAPFNPDEYETADRFPDGAEIIPCHFCGFWFVVPTGQSPYCARHFN